MQLEFNIKCQTLSRIDSCIPVEKSQEYLFAHFEFDNDWQGLNKICYANGIMVEINSETNICEIPYNAIKYPYMNLHVVGSLDEKIITTTVFTIAINKTGSLIGEQPLPNQPLLVDTWYNNFQFSITNRNIVLSMINKNGELTTKQIMIPSDNYIVSGYYDYANQRFVFTMSDGTKIYVAYSLDLSDYYTKEQIDNKNYAIDQNYVHTDNNYTTVDKDKLASLSNYDDTQVNSDINELQVDSATTSNQFTDIVDYMEALV